MTVLSSARRTAIIDKITLLEARLEGAYAVLEESLANANKSYKIDTTEGMQAVVKRDFKEITDLIGTLEAQINYLERKIRGNSNMNLNSRRKNGRLRGRSW